MRNWLKGWLIIGCGVAALTAAFLAPVEGQAQQTKAPAKATNTFKAPRTKDGKPNLVPSYPAVAKGRVRHVGQPVALVVAETLAQARDALDHRFLDEINDLGPATMENLSRWIWNRLRPVIGNLHKITVYRDSSGEACSYWGDEVAA